ncbi:MAG: hypothetical protein KF819_32095 [Labilithrix sp.]|nr:hypothetical protein [Labilithrix sp.]
MSATEEVDARRAALISAVLQLVAGLVAFVVVVAVVSWVFREELTSLGTAFIDRLGAFGMAAGAFLADAVHFPIPPQFYLFAGVAGGYGDLAVLASVASGSILGGIAAFFLARRACGLPFFARRALAARQLVQGLFARYGYWGLALAALLPISYWALCTMAGLLRLPPRASGVLGLMRIPRLLVSYGLIMLAWRATAP